MEIGEIRTFLLLLLLLLVVVVLLLLLLVVVFVIMLVVVVEARVENRLNANEVKFDAVVVVEESNAGEPLLLLVAVTICSSFILDFIVG